MSCTDTREREELDALEGKLVSRGSALFGKQQVVQKGDSLKHYEDLISQSKLPCACDIADEMLAQAYSCTQEQDVRAAMERIRRHVPRHERQALRQGCPPRRRVRGGDRRPCLPPHQQWQGRRDQLRDRDAQEGRLGIP